MAGTRPPGPAGDRLTGNLAAFSADPLAFLTESARRYGDVVSLGAANVLLADPADIERVLIDRDGAFAKITPNARKRGPTRGFPLAMMNSEGADWHAKRRRIQPAFGRQLIDHAAGIAAQEAERVIGCWRVGERRDLHSEISRVTLRAVTRLMFGAELGQPDVAVVTRLIAGIMDLSVPAVTLPRWIPTPAVVRVRRARRALSPITSRIADAPPGTGSRRGPVLHALVTGDPVPSPAELRDELATLIMAGYEATNDAVVWASYLLATHPEEAQRLADEADVAQRAGEGTALAPESLPYTNAVIREALRLYPPGWLTGREAVREVEFQGYTVPAGTSLAVSQWVTHRDPRFHDRPTEFIPSRWLGGSTGSVPRGAYFPFGLGPRACLGASVAMTEAAVIVAALWRRFRLELPEGAQVRPRPALALQPVGATFRLMPHGLL